MLNSPYFLFHLYYNISVNINQLFSLPKFLTVPVHPLFYFERDGFYRMISSFTGTKCRCCPATPTPKDGVLLLHYILFIKMPKQKAYQVNPLLTQ